MNSARSVLIAELSFLPCAMQNTWHTYIFVDSLLEYMYFQKADVRLMMNLAKWSFNFNMAGKHFPNVVIK